MLVGQNEPLYILPFDHRGSFQSKMFGWKGELSPEQTAEIAATKGIIYDGFLKAVENGVPKEKAGILVDEQFGAAILLDAKNRGFQTACPVEKSGQDEFDFEYGADFKKHIEHFRPTFSKVLVRYNPEGDKDMNRRQTDRLAQLSEYLAANGNSKFMFELLVVAEKGQLEKVGGDKKAFDRNIRPQLMVQAIHELQDAKIEPAVWKIEGLDKREDCTKIAAAIRRDGRQNVGAIILGRGEDGNKVVNWLRVAAPVPGFIGFAVGRTTFWDPLVQFRAGQIDRNTAVTKIATRYETFVHIFENTKAAV